MARERSGYVYEKDGSWYARITFTNEQGKRRDIKRKANNKTEAKKLLNALLHELENKGCQSIETSRLTFNDLANFYEAHYLHPASYIGERKVSGMRDWKHARYYLTVFRNYFGKQLLRQITYSDLRTFRMARLQTPTQYNRQRSPSTVNRELACLRRILNIAEREGYISKNPFRSGDCLISVSDEVKRERVLSHDEEKRLLAACVGRCAHLRPLIIAGLDTAMRSGELIKLVWGDVCFDSDLIRIRTLNSKTGRARLVAMTPRLKEELWGLYYARPQNVDELVFGVTDNFKNGFATVCRTARIEGFRFHDTRHTAITRMVAAGVAPMEIMKVSGHSQMSTFARYVNPTEQAVKKAAEALSTYNSEVTTPLEISGLVN